MFGLFEQAKEHCRNKRQEDSSSQAKRNFRQYSRNEQASDDFADNKGNKSAHGTNKRSDKEDAKGVGQDVLKHSHDTISFSAVFFSSIDYII